MTARVIDLNEYRRNRTLVDYPSEVNDVLFESEEGVDWIIIMGDEWGSYLTFL